MMSPKMSIPRFSSSATRWFCWFTTEPWEITSRKRSRQRSSVPISKVTWSAWRLRSLRDALEILEGQAREETSESSFGK